MHHSRYNNNISKIAPIQELEVKMVKIWRNIIEEYWLYEVRFTEIFAYDSVSD
jgi:hypothetical protein